MMLLSIGPESIQQLIYAFGNIEVHSLFTDHFMKEYSRLDTFDDFLRLMFKSIYGIEDLVQMNAPGLDKLVQTNTEFSNWWEMLDVASNYFIAHQVK